MVVDGAVTALPKALYRHQLARHGVDVISSSGICAPSTAASRACTCACAPAAATRAACASGRCCCSSAAAARSSVTVTAAWACSVLCCRGLPRVSPAAQDKQRHGSSSQCGWRVITASTVAPSAPTLSSVSGKVFVGRERGASASGVCWGWGCDVCYVTDDIVMSVM